MQRGNIEGKFANTRLIRRIKYTKNKVKGGNLAKFPLFFEKILKKIHKSIEIYTKIH